MHPLRRFMGTPKYDDGEWLVTMCEALRVTVRPFGAWEYDDTFLIYGLHRFQFGSSSLGQWREAAVNQGDIEQDLCRGINFTFLWNHGFFRRQFLHSTPSTTTSSCNSANGSRTISSYRRWLQVREIVEVLFRKNPLSQAPPECCLTARSASPRISLRTARRLRYHNKICSGAKNKYCGRSPTTTLTFLTPLTEDERRVSDSLGR